MLVWHIGIKSEFRVNLGSHNKRLQKYLEPELWRMFLATYADGDVEQMWEALFIMTSLFCTVAPIVGDELGYAYPSEDDERVAAHLEHIRLLPRDA